MRAVSYILCLLMLFNCAKQKPKSSLVGRWEIIEIRETFKQDSDLLESFKADIAYFNEITFYPDSLVYIPYLNREERLGTYKFSENFYDIEGVIAQFELKHADFIASEKSEQFEFFNADCSIKKITHNRLVLDLNFKGLVKYKTITITLKKTGVFKK
jgi:hypothetical protein